MIRAATSVLTAGCLCSMVQAREHEQPTPAGPDLAAASKVAWRVGPPGRPSTQASVDVQASEVPRFDAAGSMAGTGTRRLDITVMPVRRNAFGFSAALGHRANGSGHWHGSAMEVDLGVRWRHAWNNEERVDITAWRRVTPPPDALTLIHAKQTPVYGARIEMKLKPARVGLIADYRFLGLQLQGGGRISLRKKEGRPTLYYRTQF